MAREAAPADESGRSGLLHESARHLGQFIRSQRQLAGLSLRELASLARVSNPYLSQVERGQHQPSLRVLLGIAEALDVSADVLLSEAGLTVDKPTTDTEHAIRTDPLLTDSEKDALLTVYRSYVAARRPSEGKAR